MKELSTEAGFEWKRWGACAAMVVFLGCGSSGGKADASHPADARGDSVSEASSPDSQPDANDASGSAGSDAATDAGTGGVGGAGGTDAVNCGSGGFIGGVGSLVSNGGFECPMVGQASFMSFSTGQAFFGWTVVGAPGGSVSSLSGAYENGAFKWPAHGGAQTLDLTGDGSNSAAGVSQAIVTVPGTTYHLSFWVGNIAGPDTMWGTSSTVNVSVDGALKLTAVNSDGAGTTTLAWKSFTLDFVAATTATTLEFVNGDPSTDNSNILDDVVVSP